MEEWKNNKLVPYLEVEKQGGIFESDFICLLAEICKIGFYFEIDRR